MGNREEPAYQPFKGRCRKCGKEFTYYNSCHIHADDVICRECEKAETEANWRKAVAADRADQEQAAARAHSPNP